MTTTQSKTASTNVQTFLNEQERRAYIDKQQARLDGWMADVDKLKARISQLNASAKEKAFQQIDQQLETLQGARDVVQATFSELQEASTERWSNLVEESEEAFDLLSDQIRAFVAGIDDRAGDATPTQQQEQSQP